MYLTRLRKVETPKRAHLSDAGIDFFVPIMTKEFRQDFKKLNNPRFTEINDTTRGTIIYVPAGHSALIPSGIAVKMNPDMALVAFNKSGVATKKSLIIGACVIDPQYTGEIHLHLMNVSDNPVSIKEGEKIAQFILWKISRPEMHEIDIEEFAKITKNAERGNRGFGSTNKEEK